MVLNCHVLAFDWAGFVEAFAEGGDIARVGIGRPVSDKPDHRHRGLLRACRKRPRRRRAADERDELAAFHSITSSASPSSGSGTVSPSALAVLRLMTSVYLSACWIGRSPGFVPLRMRPHATG